MTDHPMTLGDHKLVQAALCLATIRVWTKTKTQDAEYYRSVLQEAVTKSAGQSAEMHRIREAVEFLLMQPPHCSRADLELQSALHDWARWRLALVQTKADAA